MYYKINASCIKELAREFFDKGHTDVEKVKGKLNRTNDRRNGLHECLLIAMLIEAWRECMDGHY